MDDARRFLLYDFPHADPQWLGGEERGERRVDFFLVKDQGSNVSRTGGVYRRSGGVYVVSSFMI
jgi:hypothetical protein